MGELCSPAAIKKALHINIKRVGYIIDAFLRCDVSDIFLNVKQNFCNARGQNKRVYKNVMQKGQKPHRLSVKNAVFHGKLFTNW